MKKAVLAALCLTVLCGASAPTGCETEPPRCYSPSEIGDIRFVGELWHTDDPGFFQLGTVRVRDINMDQWSWTLYEDRPQDGICKYYTDMGVYQPSLQGQYSPLAEASPMYNRLFVINTARFIQRDIPGYSALNFPTFCSPSLWEIRTALSNGGVNNYTQYACQATPDPRLPPGAH